MAAGLEKNQEGNDNMQATVAGVDQERASLRQGATTWDVGRWQFKGQDRARKHTAAWHKESRDVLDVKQAEPGGGAEGGDGLQRVTCDGLMLA